MTILHNSRACRMLSRSLYALALLPLAACEAAITSSLRATVVAPSPTRTGAPTTVTPQPTSAPEPTMPPATALTTPASAAGKLTTPALIEQARAQGTITPDQRLLYLAYAIYDYEQLPPQFRSNASWDGTPVVEELRETITTPAAMCALDATIQSEVRRLLPGAVSCNP